MKNIVLLVMVAACTTLCAEEAFKTVHGRGRNAVYGEAVNEALAQAMGQVQGAAVQYVKSSLDDYMLRVRQNANGNTNDVDEVRQALKQTAKVDAKGYIASYDITQEIYNKDMGLWFIDVDAKVPGQYKLEPSNNRRRMVVIPFRSTVNNEVEVYGRKLVIRERSEEIARRLNDRLTQTRRFSMLDREFTEDTDAELSRLNMDNASPSDIVRRYQKLVTDYMVVGTFRIYDSPKAVHNQFTGTSSIGDGPFLEVSYRVLIVPTSQLKWANTVTIPYSACAGTDVKEILAQGMEIAARTVANEIIDNIHPVRVTGKTAFELVLNQGGDNFSMGETLLAFRAGEPVIDVASGEPLGQAEEQIAQLRISRVTPQMSYAVWTAGTPLDKIPVGTIVRRPMNLVGGAGAPPAGMGSAVEVRPDGSVVQPWLKNK